MPKSGDLIEAEGCLFPARFQNASAVFRVVFDDGKRRGALKLDVFQMCHSDAGSFGRVNESRLIAYNTCVVYDEVLCPRVTVLIYSNGTGVMSGISSEEHGLIGVNLFAHMVLGKQMGIAACVDKYAITNIVAVMNMPVFGTEGLMSMQESLGSRCTYEPGQFPSARIQGTSSTSAMFLVSATGAIIITGSPDIDAVRQCISEAHVEFLKYTRSARTSLTRAPSANQIMKMMRAEGAKKGNIDEDYAENALLDLLKKVAKERNVGQLIAIGRERWRT